MTPQMAPIRQESGKPKLLFVDDHHLVLDALTFMASPEYEVRGLDSLKEFEEAVDESVPDLAILDVRMPDGDGFETGQRLVSKYPDLKILFLSLLTEAKHVRRAMEIGAYGYISKHAPAEEILLAIRTILNGGKYMGTRMQFGEPDGQPENALTERQKEVLRLISQGYSAKEIASTLSISVRTAEFHRAAIMDRLKLHSTALMTRYAVERGLD